MLLMSERSSITIPAADLALSFKVTSRGHSSTCALFGVVVRARFRDNSRGSFDNSQLWLGPHHVVRYQELDRR